MQLFEDLPAAGKSTVTFFVSGLREEHRRLTSNGLHPGELKSGDQVSLIRLNDPE
jgi:hypothetical protein